MGKNEQDRRLLYRTGDLRLGRLAPRPSGEPGDITARVLCRIRTSKLFLGSLDMGVHGPREEQ